MTDNRLIPAASVVVALLAACGTEAADVDAVTLADTGGSFADVGGYADAATDSGGGSSDAAVYPLAPGFDCTYPDLIWTAPRYERWLEPAWIGFSPNGALAMLTFHGGFGSTGWRLSDGFTVSGGGTAPFALSSDWATIAMPAADSVFDVLVDGEPTVSLDPPDLIPGWLAADVSDDGRRAAVTSCANEMHYVHVVYLDRDNEVERFEFSSSEGECYTYPSRPSIAFEPGAEAVLFAPATGTRLIRIDLATGATAQIATHEAGEPVDDMPAVADLFAMAVRPDGTEVATTGSDFLLRRWSLPGLEPIGEPMPVGGEVLNEMTYAPWWTASPIAWSPSGDFIAYIEPSLDAVIRRTEDMSLFATIALSQLPIPADDFPTDDNAFASLVFTPDGQDLLLVSQHGAALFGCQHTLPAVPEAIELEVDGPSAARPTGTAHYTVTLPDGFDHAIVRVSVDGGESYHDIRGLNFSWYLDSSRLYTFDFVVTDGVREARASRTLHP